MKKYLYTSYGATKIDVALLLLRTGIAAMMLVHGIPKLGMLFSDGPVAFPGVMGMSPALSLGLAVFAEVLCSILLLMGLVTRFAVIPLIVTMMTAVFYIHAADPFANQEPGLLYLMVYVILLVLGSGKYSLDALAVKDNKRNLNPQG